MIEEISKLKKKRFLISIRREKIDNAKIQGFILAYSNELILIQYVSDFRLDGLLVLRLRDITDICSDKTNQFQISILKDEGIYSKIDFEKNYSINNWHSLFSTMVSEQDIITIEDENTDYPILMIGKLQKVNAESVVIHEFTGAARWLDEASEMFFEDISSLQIGNHYANMYQKYLGQRP